MPYENFTYVIVGGGLAGASAVQGIREIDRKGSVLLIGRENHLPYDRPPLSKKLWFGQKQVGDIFVRDQAFYDENRTRLELGATVTALDPGGKKIFDDKGRNFGYERLLLATGGVPQKLPVPGGELQGVCYYRYLDDYLRVRSEAAEGKSAVVIGGGFIGSEIAAALRINKLEVAMVFPSPYLCDRVFPPYLGEALQNLYRERGIRVLNGDRPVSLSRKGKRFVTQAESGQSLESDILIVGIGITPAVELAAGAGLKVGNGIVVNEYLESSEPGVFAAGDNAFFPYRVLGKDMRVEHWDNALAQGRWAGRNMAGAGEPFDYMPYFFSDLFEFGYEAVGEVDSRLTTFADWQKENDTGVIYYTEDGRVRGVMLCNVWGKVDAARELIRKGEALGTAELRGLIR